MQIKEIMADAGLVTRVDAVANVRGKIAGKNAGAPVLLSGSHYDTVKDAGRFDGILGVIVPIAALKAVLVAVSPLTIQIIDCYGLSAPMLMPEQKTLRETEPDSGCPLQDFFCLKFCKTMPIDLSYLPVNHIKAWPFLPDLKISCTL